MMTKRFFPYVSLVLLALPACDDRMNAIPPEQAAATFVSDLGFKISGTPNCTQVDTDKDGYVTCTVAILDRPDTAPRILSLQCAGVTTKYASGCKQTEVKMPAPVSGS